jgi:KUP system potassium uptake protein
VIEHAWLIPIALFGASLLMSEGMITPAISVLGAVEGLEVVAPGGGIDDWVVPITVAILIGLFLVQRRGTAGIGQLFGPVMVVWFLAIAAAGIPWIFAHPHILWAVDPRHAITFFLHNGPEGFFVLGSVVLCITGGEALYADMGHFGRRPIRIAWFALVLPALMINYMGQGAILLHGPASAHEHPFYALVNGTVFLIPMVIIATCAAVVASQALISGSFSIARQAIQMGYLPRMTIVHTASEMEGQIYIPQINWLLMVACVLLVLTFGSSSALAAAYGMSVMGTMTITSVLFLIAGAYRWGLPKVVPLVIAFLVVDLAFLAANTVKIPTGGWVPLAIAAVMLTVMLTWKKGRERLAQYLRSASVPLDHFLDDIAARSPHRVDGTAVFMTSAPMGTPPVLLHHFKHNKVLHEQIVLLSVVSEDQPFVARAERVQVEKLRHGFWRVTAHYGFMQTPRVTDILKSCHQRGLHTNRDDTSFFLGRETLVLTKKGGMALWRKMLFAVLSRNSRPATDFFQLPPNRVVEMGMQIEL